MDTFWTLFSIFIGFVWHHWRKSSGIQKRKMPFSSIPPRLQGKIADQLPYFDQMHFELSSKHGKRIVSQSKRSPVLDVTDLNILYREKSFAFRTKERVWHIHYYSNAFTKDFPDSLRLKVSYVRIGTESLEFLNELCEKVEFVKSDITCHVSQWEPEYSAVFMRLSTIFNVKKVCMDFPPKLEESLPPFFSSQVELETGIKVTPWWLLQAKNKKMRLCDQSDLPKLSTIANLIFKDWYQTRRTIQRFTIFTSNPYSLKAAKVFHNIPFSILWEFKGVMAEFKLLTGENVTGSYSPLREDDAICSIDRGDKKLLVFVWEQINVIQAYEYDNLNDIIDIQPHE